MRVLVTGASGLLGRYLKASTPVDVEAIWVSYRNRLPTTAHLNEVADLARPGELLALMERYRPDVVINAAAEGSVDLVQAEPDRYRQINVSVVDDLVEGARRVGAFIVHISSNAVFASSQNSLDEVSARAPINRYGELKLEAELKLETASINYSIVRPIMMYGWPYQFGRPNVVSSWFQDLRQRRVVYAAQDVLTQPLFAGDCACLVWEISKSRIQGPLNLSGDEDLNLVAIARAIARTLGEDEGLVEPTYLKDFTGLAPRPQIVRFDTTRAKREVSFFPTHLEDGLSIMNRYWGEAIAPAIN